MVRRPGHSWLPGLLAFPLLAGAFTLSAQERPIVMIDPGHGGADAGVVDGDLVEKDLVLRIAFAIGSELVRNGYDVRLTRSGDHAVAWEDRRALAEQAGASLLLMLHLNRSEDRTRHGAEVYADLEIPASARAAAAVAEALEDAGSEVLMEERPWPFLKSTTVPTVMVELAFMTHPVERRLIQSQAFHRELGEAMVRATRRILEAEEP
jgi:N-acetylmuramoyl-L-alanine amidase